MSLTNDLVEGRCKSEFSLPEGAIAHMLTAAMTVDAELVPEKTNHNPSMGGRRS